MLPRPQDLVLRRTNGLVLPRTQGRSVLVASWRRRRSQRWVRALSALGVRAAYLPVAYCPAPVRTGPAPTIAAYAGGGAWRTAWTPALPCAASIGPHGWPVASVGRRWWSVLLALPFCW